MSCEILKSATNKLLFPFAEVVLQTKVGYIQQFYWVVYSVSTVYSFIV